jgi:hypothetical protein
MDVLAGEEEEVEGRAGIAGGRSSAGA